MIFKRRPRPPAETGEPKASGTKPADDKRARPRGLRPLPVVALCCVVAVLAVMVTRAVGMPLYSSSGAHAGTPDATDTQVDAATGEQSDGSDGSDGSDSSDQPPPDETPDGSTTAPATGATQPSPTPAPPAAPPVSRPGPPSRQPPPPAPPPSATPSPAPSPSPSPATSYEAESPVNTLAGTTVVSCSGCSGGKKVGHVGRGTGTLRFNQVTVANAANRTVTIFYVNGDPSRTATLSVNGGAPITIDFPSSGGWNTVRTMILTLALNAGPNTLTFASDSAAPDFDRITID